MRRLIIQLLLPYLLVLIAYSSNAQPYSIGNTTITFQDASRNRPIEANIYYPANTTGTDVPVENGQFPVLVFGHGFVMSPDAYANLWEVFVPRGYIMVLPTTESGFSPSHLDFGADISYLVDAMQRENSEPNSLFIGKVAPTSAVMGHSMGGGASFLALSNNNPNITAIVNYAAAVSGPETLNSAANTTVPALMFAGAVDCVTPPLEHQIPLYDSLASPCKTYISIKGGGHCYFANNSLACTTGESFCMPIIPLDRASQHSVVADFSNLWLDGALKNDANAKLVFKDSLFASNRITYQRACGLTSTSELLAPSTLFKVFPNPANHTLQIQSSLKAMRVELLDINGRLLLQKSTSAKSLTIPVDIYAQGVYIVRLQNGQRIYYKKILIQ